ncbi:MAG: outer membrane protein transport protein [Myxococcota bacterium]
MNTPKSFRTARFTMGIACGFALALSQLVVPLSAQAAGFDAPVLNSAKYAGMGGTGIAFVDGGPSLYINPAGLGRIDKGDLYLAVSVIVPKLRASPTFLEPDLNLQQVVLPVAAPNVGFSVRLTKFFSVGAAAFPAGAAGGEYNYPLNDSFVEDEVKLILIEVGPAIAFNFDKIGLYIGAGYRITVSRLQRDFPVPPLDLDLDMRGVDFAGFRVGFQWQFTDWLSIGAVYRNEVSVNTNQKPGEEAIAIGPRDSVSASVPLPSRVGGGVRLDFGSFGTAAEFEWLFNGEVQTIPIIAEPPLPENAAFVLDWKDQFLVRWGGEYAFFDDQWPVRLGFVYGSRSQSLEFPNAFGPTPAPEYVMTLGTGYNHGPWQMSLAYARLWSSTNIEVDTTEFLFTCPNCGGNGKYSAKGNFFFWDFTYSWR